MWGKLLNWRMSFQLGLLQTLLQIVVALCLALAVGYIARQHILALEIDNLHGHNRTAIAAFTSYDRSLTPFVNARMGRLKEALPGKFALQAPGALAYDGQPAAAAFNAAAAGISAALFARNGQEFVRVASASNKEDGGSDVQSNLDHKNPAYAALSKGQGFTGLMRDSGRTYLARYEPIFDANAVIGAFAVMRSLQAEITALNAGMSTVKIGETGYVYALDRDGIALVHPKLAGTNLFDAQDADGKFFIREMMATRNGERYYYWANPGEKAAREKIAAFDTYEPWGLLVGSGAYTDELTVTVRSLVVALLLASVVALVVQVALMQFVTHRTVALPISRLAASMNQVATGDLTVSFTSYPDTRSEVRQIENSAGKAIGFMHEVVVSARDSATAVQASAQNLARAMGESSFASQTQSQETHSVAAAVEELAVSAASISDMVGEATTGTGHSSELAFDGTSLALAANSRAQEVSASVSSTVTAIQKLADDAEKIAGAGALIRGIAEQTNLLSLNAAIEAARAGEQGRGFAVVADEVRKLATRTAESTANIDTLVGAILERIKLVQDAVQTVANSSEQSLSAAEQASRSFESIYTSASDASTAIQSAKDATNEQKSASDSVAHSVQRIADQANAVAHASQAAEAEARALEQQARRLQEKVAVFRL